MKTNKKIIFLSSLMILVGSVHLFYIFQLFPPPFIFLTIAIDILGISIYLYMMFYIRKIYFSEKKQKAILLNIMKENENQNIQILLKIKSMLEYLKDSVLAQDFLKDHEKQFSFFSDFNLEKYINLEFDSAKLLEEYIETNNKMQSILLDYINQSNQLLKTFTIKDFIYNLFVLKVNFSFFKSYINSFFDFMNNLYQQIHQFSSEFYKETQIIDKETENLKQSSHTIENNFKNYNLKIINFTKFVNQFNQANLKFIESISSDYEKNLIILKNIQEISEKIKILSLNLSIEASRTSSNKVFDVLAEELQSFSERIQNFSNKIKEEILQTNNKIHEESQSQLKQLSVMNQQTEEMAQLQQEIFNIFENFKLTNQYLIFHSKDILEKSETSLREFLNAYQNLKVIEESFKNFFNTFDAKHKNLEDTLVSITKLLYRDESMLKTILEEIIKEFASSIKTEKELKILLEICDSYHLYNCKKQLESKFTKSDVILF